MVARVGHLLARELASFLLIPFLLFGLFYLEYALVETMIKRELDFRFGYIQVAGSWVIVVFATLTLWFANQSGAQPSGLQEYVLLLMGIFGEILFVANVVLTYMHQDGVARTKPAFTGQKVRTPPVRTPAVRTPPTRAASNSGWPQSPAKVFGIATAFFLLAGFILVAVRPLSRLPLPWHGEISQVAAGYLWIATAAPFAIFALVYWGIEEMGGRVFEIPATRIHFICTVLVVAEGLHEYISWASSWAGRSSWNYPETSQFFGVLALAVMVAASFIWNLWSSRRAR